MSEKTNSTKINLSLPRIFLSFLCKSVSLKCDACISTISLHAPLIQFGSRCDSSNKQRRSNSPDPYSDCSKVHHCVHFGASFSLKPTIPYLSSSLFPLTLTFAFSPCTYSSPAGTTIPTIIDITFL